jgi:hypothetical protein
MRARALFDASMWFMFEFKVKNYEEFKEKYPLGSEGRKKFIRYAMFCEILSVLAKNGLLNTDMYFDAFGGTKFRKAKLIAKGFRKERESSSILENWELLEKKSKEYWDKRKLKIPEEK